ncbi:MAG: 30S ribosomal protein S6 [Planctomycetes bacterium]|nr:30S ribosomal protein S6 [Planctomycetota bacterium]
MFLLDNAVVREDWKKAKAVIHDAVAKHGGTVKTSRRWDERRLAYPIRGKNRATYVLCYVDIPGANLPVLRRELELSERVLRYLILAADEIPAAEHELSAAENADGFVVPAPPPDDVIEPEPAPAPIDPVEEILAEGELPDDRPRGRRPERANVEVAP